MKTETKNNDFNIFRQLTNSIDGVIDLTSSTVSFNLLDGNRNTVFQKLSPTIISDIYGLVKVEILATDTINLINRDYFMEFLVDGDSVLIEIIRFKDMLSGTEYLRSGVTADRPSLPTAQYIGFNYYDSTIGREIVWSGSAWVDISGDNETDISALDVRVTDNETDISTNRTDFDELDANARITS